jgi:hypothetical protein
MALLDHFMESPAGSATVLLTTVASCALCGKHRGRWCLLGIALPGLIGLHFTFVMFQFTMIETSRPGVWHDDLRLYLRPHLVPSYWGLTGSVVASLFYLFRRKQAAVMLLTLWVTGCVGVTDQSTGRPYAVIFSELSETMVASFQKILKRPPPVPRKISAEEARLLYSEIKSTVLTAKMTDQHERPERLAVVQAQLAAGFNKMQFIGFTAQGQDYVLVNALPPDIRAPNWTHDYVVIFDGGTSVWQGIWNTKSRKFDFVNIHAN